MRKTKVSSTMPASTCQQKGEKATWNPGPAPAVPAMLSPRRGEPYQELNKLQNHEQRKKAAVGLRYWAMG
jgi:hypothetical protein